MRRRVCTIRRKARSNLIARAGRSRLPDRKNACRSTGFSTRRERSMHHFAYRAGVMHAEAVDLASLAQAVSTPLYCYSTATLERHYRVFAEAFADGPSLVCYAMKANSNQAVIATLARLGAGADVVSGGGLKRAFGAGVPAEQ